MQDPRQFIRYVLPGLTFVIETALYLYLSDPMWVKNLFWKIADSPGGSIGVLLTTFLLSGGIGYLFSIIYYTFIANRLGDHRPMLRSAANLNYLEFRSEDNDNVLDRDEVNRSITRLGAWRIVNALWHERLRTSRIIRGANPGNETRAHIAHGLGISTFGAFLAILAWYGLHKEISSYSFNFTMSNGRWLILCATIGIIFVCHIITYFRAIHTAYEVTNKILLGVLRDESVNGRLPVRCLVNERDL